MSKRKNHTKRKRKRGNSVSRSKCLAILREMDAEFRVERILCLKGSEKHYLNKPTIKNIYNLCREVRHRRNKKIKGLSNHCHNQEIGRAIKELGKIGVSLPENT